MRHFIEKILAFLAKRVLAKYKPLIIGITGSVGKTSTRQAVFCVVKEHFRSFTPARNLNTLLGLPLGVLMQDSPERSLLGWLKVFLWGAYLILFKYRYPEVLVLEYGIDKPGEMEMLINIARPNIAILTGVGESHLEFFESRAHLADEKGKLISSLVSGGTAIINRSNEAAVLQAKKIFESRKDIKFLDYAIYGFEDAAVHADDVSESFEGAIETEVFVKTPTRVPRFTLGAIGEAHVLAGLAAVAVAEALKISSEDIKKGLLNYRPQPGRLNVISGIKKSLIIDDTYNSSPSSVLVALDTLKTAFALWKSYKRIAVLGDMLELGGETVAMHEYIGRRVAELKFDSLICVGDLSKSTALAAERAGMKKDAIHWFSKSLEAVSLLQEMITENTIVLVKGSQGMRMEKIVKEIMSEPMRAVDLLCRQNAGWQKKL